MRPPEAPEAPIRKIIHIDMDCFYAAVEIRDRPELATRPVAVGGSSGRGVLTTCNYVARQFGCRSAMPAFKARQLCPELIILPTRFDTYREESRRVRAILADYTDLIEPLSLDEAFLDVSAQPRYAWDLAREIRRRIREETGLTASAGVAPNKLLAKIASDWRKPDGQFAVPPDRIQAFMTSLPVRRIWGIGPKSAARLSERGITTCGELQQLETHQLRSLFGRFGDELYRLSRGIDDRPVVPHRLRKSLSAERTFRTNIEDLEGCAEALEPIRREVAEDLHSKARDRYIQKIFVTVRFSDFSRTTAEAAGSWPEPEPVRQLLATAFNRKAMPVRLLGVGVRFAESHDSANEAGEQLEFTFGG